jgi:hypothetical protein
MAIFNSYVKLPEGNPLGLQEPCPMAALVTEKSLWRKCHQELADINGDYGNHCGDSNDMRLLQWNN